jgi:hypothetical protein
VKFPALPVLVPSVTTLNAEALNPLPHVEQPNGPKLFAFAETANAVSETKAGTSERGVITSSFLNEDTQPFHSAGFHYKNGWKLYRAFNFNNIRAVDIRCGARPC